MNFMRANLLSFLTLGLMIAITAYLYSDLPDTIPTNYDLQGTARDESPKSLIATIIPISYLLVIFVVNILIRISPEKFSMPNSKRAMDLIVFGTGLLLVNIHIGILISAGNQAIFTRYFSLGMALFLIVVGNVFGKTERNFFIGIRLPWTLASTANWRATHRFAGKLMVAFGTLLLVSTFIRPNLFVTVFMSVCPLLIPVIYSYVYYARNEVASR